MDKIKWSREHLKVLERAFPELVSETNTNTLLVNSGKRAVVHYVKSIIESQETRVPSNDAVSLPR